MYMQMGYAIGPVRSRFSFSDLFVQGRRLCDCLGIWKYVCGFFLTVCVADGFEEVGSGDRRFAVVRGGSLFDA